MSGRWIERSPMYLSFDIYNCTYCGKNVPRNVWLQDLAGESVPFCSPDVAQIYVRTRRHPENLRRDDAGDLTEELRAVRRGCAALRDRREIAESR